MPRTTQYQLHCPKCKAPHSADLVEAIHLPGDAFFREQLLSGRLNTPTCPACGHSYRVDTQMMYNDSARRAIIQLVPSRLDQVSEVEEHFLDTVEQLVRQFPDDPLAPRCHLVLSRSELVERIFVLEADLDPRILEYLKYSIYLRNMERLPHDEKMLLLDPKASTPEDLFFVVQDARSGRIESVIQHKRAAYDALVELFGQPEKGTELFDMFPGPCISARALMTREVDEALGLEDGDEEETPGPS